MNELMMRIMNSIDKKGIQSNLDNHSKGGALSCLLLKLKCARAYLEEIIDGLLNLLAKEK